jgi:hypothetical protein
LPQVLAGGAAKAVGLYLHASQKTLSAAAWLWENNGACFKTDPVEMS